MTQGSSQLWRLILKGQAQGQNQTVNVFHYRGSSPDTDEEAQNIIDAFKTNIMPLWVNCVHEDWASTIIQAFELNGSKFAEDGTVFNGQRTGNIMPGYVTVALRYQRQETGFRNGWKRLGPLSESDVNNQASEGTYGGIVNILAADLGDPLIATAAGGGSIRPIILRRASTYEPTYQYSPCNEVTFRGIGSQVTRKVPYG